MVLPKRPIQHQREDESRKALDSLLPSRFIFRPEHREYGIDGEIEEFDESGEATGRRFRVQLKATGESGAAAMRERIKLTTAAYYRAQHLPVLMVRYVAATQRLYGRWFHEFDPYYEHVGDTHLTFHWSEGDELSAESFDALFADVERIIRLKSVGVDLPLTVALITPEAGVHGCAQAELELAFEAGLGRCPGVLKRIGAGDDADLKTAIEQDGIRASVGGLASVFMHIDDEVYPPGTDPDTIVADTLSCAAVALARSGHGEPAARIATQFFADSLVSGVPPIGGELAAAMVHAGRIVEVIDLADRLDQVGDEAHESCAGVLMEMVRTRTESLQPHEQTRYEAALRGRLERRLERGETRLASASAENVGRLLMANNRPRDAIEFLEQAVALDPDRATPEVEPLLAGAYFLSGQYTESVAAYDRALDTSGDPDPGLQARRADALLHAGCFRAALAAFNEIETDERELSAWIYVKARALSWVIQATGIEEQRREVDRANELAGGFSSSEGEEDADDLASRVWDLDAASPLGWFNRARDLLDRGREEDAMHAYLTTAVMQEGDVEAWVNVAILAMNVGDADLFETSVITGDRLNKGEYVRGFMRQLRETVPDVAHREEILRLVRQAVQSS